MSISGPQFQFDAAKFKELVLYICAKCDPSKLGAVKLHKVLYYADMLRYVETGQPITGAVYRKRPLGPTADALLRAISDLQRDGALDVNSVSFFGFQKKEFRAKRKPDLEKFSASEVSFVDEVIAFVCEENTAKEISELSHSLAWEAVGFGEVMPYYSAFLMFKEQVPEEAFNLGSEEIAEVEGEGSEQNSLGFPDFAAVREGVRAGHIPPSKN